MLNTPNIVKNKPKKNLIIMNESYQTPINATGYITIRYLLSE